MTMKRYSRANKLKFEEFRKKGKKKKKNCVNMHDGADK